MKEPLFFIIDLFCGFGGTTEGYENTDGLARVVACINHDPKAIRSHALNHPHAEHYTEDITEFYGAYRNGIFFMSPQMIYLRRLVDIHRAFYPDAEIILWASLECTNFSIAKGGGPKDADSRTLGDHLDFYVDALKPDHIKIENVKEFKKWGPLTPKGYIIKDREGEYFDRWRTRIKNNFGYRDEWKLMNSADYGGFTSRLRLFGIFTWDSEIHWPETTHERDPKPDDLFAKPKWNGVRPKLRMEKRGKSIFGRKKPLAEKTLERIYEGVKKHGHDEAFLSKYFSGDPASKNISLDGPAHALKPVDNHSICFLTKYHGNGFNIPIDQPCPTLATKDQVAIIQAIFLFNPQWFGTTLGIDKPCPTLIARQDKAPLYVIIATYGGYVIPVFDDDSEMTVKLKGIMAEYGITDLSMRMLMVEEMLEIQGFPPTYQMVGTQTDHKRFIGNSVHPLIPKNWAISMAIGKKRIVMPV